MLVRERQVTMNHRSDRFDFAGGARERSNSSGRGRASLAFDQMKTGLIPSEVRIGLPRASRAFGKPDWSLALWVLSSALALQLQAGCSKKADASRQEEPQIFEELAGQLFRDSAAARCGYAAFVAIRRPPIDRTILSHGCVAALADTSRYAYRDSAGRTLVTGIYLTVAPHRVHTVLDSLHRRLVARFGPSTTCRGMATSAGPVYAWDRDTIALSLWADSVVLFTRVGIEARATERICDEPMREPTKA